jgi:hypothetical protein
MLADGDISALREFLHSAIDEAVADGKISAKVAEGYHMALDYDASKRGAEMILPQFGGKLLRTQMEQVGDEGSKQYALHLNFGVSEDIRILAGLFAMR